MAPTDATAPVPEAAVAHGPDEDAVAANKNKEAWAALWKFGQPMAVVSFVGAAVLKIGEQKFENTLIGPMLTFPLAAIALASLINFDVKDFKVMARNYVYYTAKGLIVSAALFLAGPSEHLFKKLNEQWLRDVFTENLLQPANGASMRALVIFHSLNLALHPYLVGFVYGPQSAGGLPLPSWFT
jgi:hypothetical protein